MYTYVNILYSVNKELNWIELNKTVTTTTLFVPYMIYMIQKKIR